MYCHLRPPDAIAFPTEHILGFESELQINPMSFHLESLWGAGATLMPLTGCAMDWERNRILKVSKNAGVILSRLWTEVHEIFGRCTGPLYFLTPLPDCLYLVSFRIYSPLRIEDVEKPSKCKNVFRPPILQGGSTQTFLQQIVSAI